MKKITLLAASVAVMFTLAMTSCTKEEPTIVVGAQSSLTFTGLAINSISKATVETENLEADTPIGIYVANIAQTTTEDDEVINQTPANAMSKNIAYTGQADGSINKNTGDNLILTTGWTYDVYAYSPFVTDEHAVDVTKIPVVHNTNVLWTKNIPNAENAGLNKPIIPTAGTFSAPLTFDRKATQISFTIESENTDAPIDFTNASKIALTVTGFRATGSPMTLNVKLVIEAGDNAGTYEGPISNDFKAGTSWHYKIKVKDRRVDLSFTGSVTKWKAETGDINIDN